MIAGTVVAENYVPFVQVLAESFRRHHPEIPFRVLLAGDEAACAAAENEGLEVIRIADLGLPDLREMFPGYDRQQTVVALKPFLMAYLLKYGGSPAIYLDADILVTASLAPLLEEVAQHSLSVTPHIGPAATKEERSHVERALLMSGMYNAGFIAVADREETWRFLEWWERRLKTHCKCAVREGFHYDQRWFDLAPGFVTDFHLVRDPGCNAAYWNLPDLEVERSDEGFRVNGAPLRFFHFSGFDPAQPDSVSRFTPGWKVQELGAASELFCHYKMLLDEAGWANAKNASWPWDHLPRGPLQHIRAWLGKLRR